MAVDVAGAVCPGKYRIAFGRDASLQRARILSI